MMKQFIRDAPNAPLGQPHLMHKAVPCRLLYYTFHNTDTMRGWNPAYKITGRPSKSSNGGAFTHWSDRSIYSFMRLQNFSSSSSSSSSFTSPPLPQQPSQPQPQQPPRHRIRFIPSGLDGDLSLEVTIELERVEPPMDGLNKTVQVMVTPNEAYFVFYEPKYGQTEAAHVLFPVKVESRRQETPKAEQRRRRATPAWPAADISSARDKVSMFRRG